MLLKTAFFSIFYAIIISQAFCQTSDDDRKIYFFDEQMSDARIADSLMRILKKKYPQPDCNSCMVRTVDNKGKTRFVTDYDLNGQPYEREKYFTEATVTLKNKCNKNVRVLGISKGHSGNRIGYGIIWKDFQANFSTSFSRQSDDLAGSVLGGIVTSMVFGGGEMSDIDISEIGKKFDNSIQPGEFQYLRVIELNSIVNNSKSKSGTNIVEVTSYSGNTGTKVNKGDKIYLRASGSVKTGAFSGYCSPAGKEYTPMWNIVTSCNYGALLAKIGNSSWMLAGDQAQLVAPSTGELVFAVNDTDPSDNAGSFKVEYSINKPLPNEVNESLKVSEDGKSNQTTTQVPTKKSERIIFNLNAVLPKKYVGYVKNTTYNKSSFCQVNLSMNADGSYNMFGSTDNVNLVGEWDLVGYEAEKDGNKIYEFTGKMTAKLPVQNLSFNNKPILKKTSIPMTCTVQITEDGLKGTYQLAAYKHYGVQNGTLDLH